MSAIAESPPPTTVQVITYFVRSITEVLDTMAHVKVTIGKPFLKTNPAVMYDVSGIIGLSGSVSGSMVLSFQYRTAEAVVTAFAGTPIGQDSPDFADAIGELANMIAGSAKTNLGENANMSVPSIVMGPGHQIARLQGVPCVIIPCKTDSGDFAVEVNITPSKAPLMPERK